MPFLPISPTLDLKAELFFAHLCPDVPGNLGRDPDIVVEFLADILAVEVEKVGGVNGKGGVAGGDLGVDELLGGCNLCGIALLDGDVVGVESPGAKTDIFAATAIFSEKTFGVMPV